MQTKVCTWLVALALALAPASGCKAQFIGYNSPQGNAETVINGATAATTGTITKNLGQTMHFLAYSVAGNTGAGFALQIRIEARYTSTATWFPISDDGTDVNGGEVVAIGYYPFLRVNLVALNCGAVSCSVTASYSGTSSVSGVPWGSYNPAQQIRKVIVAHVSAGSGGIGVLSMPLPYANAGGLILVECTPSCPGGSTVTVAPLTSISESTLSTFTITAALQAFLVPPSPATSVNVSYVAGGASANFVSVWYIFWPPGSRPATEQAPQTANSETVSAANTAITKTLTVTEIERAHLYSLSARCSAGTSTITVADGSTQIWSSATGEVGTTTFRPAPWNPGLASSPGSNLVIVLGTCGGGNTGTLDVQASIF